MIQKRLTQLEAMLRQQRPAVLVVTLENGAQEAADPATVWDFFKNAELRKQVVNVETDSPGHVELCGVIMALCR